MGRVEPIALTGARIYQNPSDAPLLNATIVVVDGTIESAGENVTIPLRATVLDCNGCTITAGLWNAHVHFHERKWADAAAIPAGELDRQLRELTRYGFTTVFDLSSRWENTRCLRERIDSAEVSGPRILSTGEGLISTGGTPPPEVFRTLGLMETTLLEVDDVESARLACETLLAQGVHAIKLFLSSPSAGPMAPETIRAAVETAHRAHRLVFAHPNSAFDIEAALEAGVDVIAHTTPHSGPWDAALIDSMRARDAALIPTLYVWESFLRHDRVSLRDRLVETSVEQLRAWNATGGTTLFGTDLGAVEYDPSREYALMERAGTDFRRILAALTTNPAQRLCRDVNLATIATGNPADLTVLEDDPADAVANLTNVRYTIRGGEIIYARGPASAGPPPSVSGEP